MRGRIDLCVDKGIMSQSVWLSGSPKKIRARSEETKDWIPRMLCVIEPHGCDAELVMRLNPLSSG